MTITQSSTKFVAVAAGIALALSLVLAPGFAPAQAAGLTSGQVQSILSLLSSFGADQATINNVNAALNGQATTGTGTGTGGACPVLSRSLQVGSNGADVKSLQMFLNSSATTQIASAGAGSPGSESTYFGGLTKAAVIKFQSANGVSAIGIVGPATRAAIAAVCGGSTGGNTGGTGGTTGGSVTISAGAQPVNSLAVASASRVPFTTFTLTNNSSSPVTINSVTVQRTGLGVDANFSGVVLLDANGLQVGNSKTFNSNHQANIGDTGFTLGAGQSMTYTVAGNIASSATAQSGQVVGLTVVAVNSSAVVSGSLPITGASQTINTTLTLGSVSTTTSSVVPVTSSSHTQNIGDVGVRFAGLKFTAGSTEALKLYSVRWRQIGSASSADLSNVITNAAGTSYPTTVSSDGKYFTTIFPGGLLIDKGMSVDVYIQGDLTGSNTAGRTLQFTIDRVTDVYFVGQVYGYGIAPSGTSQPWFTGDSFTVNAGTASTIQKSNATTDAAQNISVNVPNQPFGGFTTNFLGEPVQVSTVKISIATSSGFTGNGPLTNISLVDQNGAVVAGPIDEATTNTSGTSLSFADTVTFPVGVHTYHLRGQIPSGVSNGSTLTVTVDPTSWSGITGTVSGNTVSLASNASFTLNQMTVRAATTTITVGSTPISQNFVSGSTITFANIQLDASQSGEDIRYSSLLLVPTLATAGDKTYVTGCQLWDGTTALNTGSRIVNSITTATNSTFTFDSSLTVPKGTVKTLALSCNVSSSITTGGSHTIIWGIPTTAQTATGVTSGTSITPTVAAAANAGTFTPSSSTLLASVDSSSPSYALKAAGSTGVTAAVLKFHASNEALNLTKVGLTLVNSVGETKSNGNGASTNGGASDVTMAYIYSGSTLVGTAAFTGTGTTATSTLTTPVTLAKDADTLLTVKVDLSTIGVSANGGIGDIVKVDPLNFEATGVSSGSTVTGPTASNTVSTGAAGVQMYKSYPTVANAGISCTNTTSCNGTAQTLKRFSITANAAGPVGLYQVAVSLATSSAKVSNLKLFAFTDSSYSQPANVSGTTAGQFGGTAPLNGTTGETTSPTVSFFQGTPLQIPIGTTYYFSVVGDVTTSGTSWSVNATVLGDSATTTLLANYNATAVAAIITHTVNVTGVATTTSASNFIWSDNATTTAAITDVDWANGYSVPGLSSSGF